MLESQTPFLSPGICLLYYVHDCLAADDKNSSLVSTHVQINVVSSLSLSLSSESESGLLIPAEKESYFGSPSEPDPPYYTYL